MRLGLGQTVSRWAKKLALFIPSDLAGSNIWLESIDGATIIKDVSDYVSEWVNKIVGGDYVQTTAAKQPLYESSGFGINNLPLISFDGIDDYLTGNTKVGTTGIITVAAKFDSTTNGYSFCVDKVGFNNTYRFYTTTTGRLAIYYRNGSSGTLSSCYTDVVLTNGEDYIASFIFKGNGLGWQIFLNGAEKTLTNAGTHTGASFSGMSQNASHIGKTSSSLLTAYSKTKIAFVHYLQDDITETSRISIEDYINDKYSIY